MAYRRHLNSLRGLTLIEVMVTITIIGILVTVISVNALESGRISRDAKRQADLRMLQSAVELYKNKNGQYPEGCNNAEVWSGQLGSQYECTNGSSQYITGLAPEFIPALPYDPKLNGTNSGYVYVTNADRSVYKIMAMRTVESESVTYGHKFASCHIIPIPPANTTPWGGTTAYDIDTAGWCRVATQIINEPTAGSRYTYNIINQCVRSEHNSNRSNRFNVSYGVWGGFAEEVTSPPSPNPLSEKAHRVSNTTKIICK